MGKRILFSIGGVGLGNATRTHAIANELIRQGYRVDVAASGRALEYFRAQKTGVENLFELPSLSYGSNHDGRLRLTNLPNVAGKFLRNGLTAYARLTRIFKATRYAVTITDSNYNLAHRLRSGAAWVAINNSDRIVKYRGELKGLGVAVRVHFYAVELIDYLFHRLVPDLVLSPWPLEEPTHTPFQGVGLIARATALRATRRGLIVVMGSGSGLGRLTVKGEPGQTIRHFGLSNQAPNYQTLEDLCCAEKLVLNAGFSALSEGLIYGRQILAVPLKNHAEQTIVCRFMSKQNLIHEDDGRPLGFQLSQIKPKPVNLNLRTDGAREVARWIERFADLSPQAARHLCRGFAKANQSRAVANPRPALDGR